MGSRPSRSAVPGARMNAPAQPWRLRVDAVAVPVVFGAATGRGLALVAGFLRWVWRKGACP